MPVRLGLAYMDWEAGHSGLSEDDSSPEIGSMPAKHVIVAEPEDTMPATERPMSIFSRQIEDDFNASQQGQQRAQHAAAAVPACSRARVEGSAAQQRAASSSAADMKQRHCGLLQSYPV